MSKICSSCGTTTTVEARFCRLCGAFIEQPHSAERATENTIVNSAAHPAETPSTATTMLSSETRSTDGLMPSETARMLPSTTQLDPDDVTLVSSNLRSSGNYVTSHLNTRRAASLAQSAARIVTAEHLTSRPLHEVHRPTKRGWMVAAGVFLCGAIGAITWQLMKSPPPAAAPLLRGDCAPSVAADAGEVGQLSAKDKLTEAEALLAIGNSNEAIKRIHEAMNLDRASSHAHRLLGDALVQRGYRRRAIEEYRAAVQFDANNIAAWSALAAAEFAEGRYNEAAESYHHLIGIARNEADIDDEVRLAYADAVRLAGRRAEAQTLYQALANSASTEVARAAGKYVNNSSSSGALLVSSATPRLFPSPLETANTDPSVPSVLPSRPPSVLVKPEVTPATREATVTAKASAAVTAASEHYNRGVELFSTNRAAALVELRQAAKSNPDANYYLGLHTIERRSLRSLHRAELLDALYNFQQAQKGRFSRQAGQYAERLGKEYDRRRQ